MWSQAGVSFAHGYGGSDINAWSASFYAWGLATGNWHPLSSGYQPQPGDAAVYGNLTEAPGPGHVGIYVSGPAGAPTVVNGNWSYPNPNVAEVYEQSNERNTGVSGGNLDGYVSVPNGGTVGAAPVITTTSLPGGIVGGSYDVGLAATGGQPPYAWRVASGSLPQGLNLSASGSLTGTPTQAGISSFSVSAKDAAGATAATTTLSIAVSPPVTIAAVMADQTLLAKSGLYGTWVLADSGIAQVSVASDAQNRATIAAVTTDGDLYAKSNVYGSWVLENTGVKQVSTVG